MINQFNMEAKALKAFASDSEYRIKNLKPVINAICDIEWSSDDEYDQFIKDLNNFINNGLLCPLTLNDDEFKLIPDSDIDNVNKSYYNIRKNCIFKNNTGIYNTNAFKINIKNVYNLATNSQENEINDEYQFCDEIYFTAGGVMTGKYFDICYIRPSIIEKHCFHVAPPVIVPVSKIYDEEKGIELYTMDIREPKFTALKKFYDIPIKDSAIKKYDIRKFNKL